MYRNNFYIDEIFSDSFVIDKDDYIFCLNRVIEILNFEDPSIRARDTNFQPGGVIKLNRDLDTIIVPDLHARTYFIQKLLNFKINNKSVLELLQLSKLQIVFVGDGFHSEKRHKERWFKIESEAVNNFINHENSDLEMAESLGVMKYVINLKILFPDQIHFLKGNHENILNENGGGNFPFGKFTLEGEIVKKWVSKFLGEDFLWKYSSFEKSLPLIAIGKNFIVSHAEPKKFYSLDQLINCYNNSDVVFGLTWTRDNQSEDGSVFNMLKEYIDKDMLDNALYFTGHQTIDGLYELRAYGKLVQIHNPNRCIIAHISFDKDIDLNNDIGDIDG
ncbi:hypothetical protein EW093_02990 [Thiospirochaeta perfilievii]|uniref:Serine/threonine specific protein phosphatases domain-containing protein n=1 Tax=Thiospirochaeta perfilievii TaxID=252967 RepID=A0A5C1Q8L8_9SPIO|nr:metallophosphoesterase [Thiospirochaeta perfilievii]QEN03708.1 hypothetical protein EW093_02990 [Thiospirochaeta perfilievii]